MIPPVPPYRTPVAATRQPRDRAGGVGGHGMLRARPPATARRRLRRRRRRPRPGSFPVSIEHQFGTATIPAAPQRVLTIGFNEQDFALAFGAEPVGVREFLGYDAPGQPWAPESVRGKAIPTVGSQELELEQVAALKPDLILGINSYIDQPVYDKLAAIAPTVAQSGDVALGATTWDQQTLVTGKALGQDAAAQQLRRADPGRFHLGGPGNPVVRGHVRRLCPRIDRRRQLQPGSDDYRTGWLTDLGSTVPKTSTEVSFEQLTVFDTDALVGEGLEAAASTIRCLPPAPGAGRPVPEPGWLRPGLRRGPRLQLTPEHPVPAGHRRTATGGGHRRRPRDRSRDLPGVTDPKPLSLSKGPERPLSLSKGPVRPLSLSKGPERVCASSPGQDADLFEALRQDQGSSGDRPGALSPARRSAGLGLSSTRGQVAQAPPSAPTCSSSSSPSGGG